MLTVITSLSGKRLVREMSVRESVCPGNVCPGNVLSGKMTVREKSIRETSCPGNVGPGKRLSGKRPFTRADYRIEVYRETCECCWQVISISISAPSLLVPLRLVTSRLQSIVRRTIISRRRKTVATSEDYNPALPTDDRDGDGIKQ